MRALDPLVYEQETDFYLEKLVEVDGFRKGYYKDLSKYLSLTIENQVLIFICGVLFFKRVVCLTMLWTFLRPVFLTGF